MPCFHGERQEMIIKHNEDTCKTCELLRAEEKWQKEINKINDKRIADRLEPLDDAPSPQAQGHCPICLSPIYEGDHWCSEKCYDEFIRSKKEQRID
jgi:hypothetical protein